MTDPRYRPPAYFGQVPRQQLLDYPNVNPRMSMPVPAPPNYPGGMGAKMSSDERVGTGLGGLGGPSRGTRRGTNEATDQDSLRGSTLADYKRKDNGATGASDRRGRSAARNPYIEEPPNPDSPAVCEPTDYFGGQRGEEHLPGQSPQYTPDTNRKHPPKRPYRRCHPDCDNYKLDQCCAKCHADHDRAALSGARNELIYFGPDHNQSKAPSSPPVPGGVAYRTHKRTPGGY